MEWLVLGFAAITFLFGFVLLYGAPYLPTLRPNMHTALDLLDLKPGDTMLELGCGDGRVLKAAAERGWKAVGYELNPILVIIAYLNTWKYRTLVTVKWGNALTAQWPKAEGVYVFGLRSLMPKLHTKIMQYQHKPLRLVSFVFDMPGRRPEKVVDSVRLYKY